VSKVCSCHRHALTVSETAHVFPVHFFVAKAGPSMFRRFDQKIFHGSSLGCSKEQFSSDGIIKLNGRVLVVGRMLFHIVKKVCCLPISGKFCIVTIEVACRRKIYTIRDETTEGNLDNPIFRTTWLDG